MSGFWIQAKIERVWLLGPHALPFLFGTPHLPDPKINWISYTSVMDLDVILVGQMLAGSKVMGLLVWLVRMWIFMLRLADSS